MLELKKLSPDDGRDIYELLQIMPKDENGLLNKANGLSFDEFKQWLIKKQADSEQKGIVDGWKVPSSTYWLYSDGVPVGFGSIRIYLTDALRKAGGNIGYGIAAPFRGKGYGKELLRLLLLEAGKAGIEKVLLTIHRDNIASRAVACANGGILTEETDERAYYWINTRVDLTEEPGSSVPSSHDVIETDRLKIYAASKEQMQTFIAAQSSPVLKAAYTEMLNGCLAHPDQWRWHVLRMIGLKDGTHIGELCFKGLSEEGVTEIGYGIAAEHRGRGYASEAVSALVNWALLQPEVKCITAETEKTNIASQRVLIKAGFVAVGENGEESPLYRIQKG